jgi:DNA-binding FrmR family transcriptional regulator
MEDATLEAPNTCCENGNNMRSRLWSDDRAVENLTVRLNRIEGQVRGIKRMIEQGVYCNEVLNQISSAQAAMYGVARLLLEKHMKCCVRNQIKAGDDQVIEEVLATLFKMMR